MCVFKKKKRVEKRKKEKQKMEQMEKQKSGVIHDFRKGIRVNRILGKFTVIKDKANNVNM